MGLGQGLGVRKRGVDGGDANIPGRIEASSKGLAGSEREFLDQVIIGLAAKLLRERCGALVRARWLLELEVAGSVRKGIGAGESVALRRVGGGRAVRRAASHGEQAGCKGG